MWPSRSLIRTFHQNVGKKKKEIKFNTFSIWPHVSWARGSALQTGADSRMKFTQIWQGSCLKFQRKTCTRERQSDPSGLKQELNTKFLRLLQNTDFEGITDRDQRQGGISTTGNPSIVLRGQTVGASWHTNTLVFPCLVPRWADNQYSSKGN